jgi:glucose-1-phosphate thymidylyltransferase
MNIILFEDSAAKQLAPITLTRPAWAISCASFRLVDWMTNIGSSITSIVRPHLQTLQLNDWPQFKQSPEPSDGSVVMVNARLAPTISNVELLRTFVGRHDTKENSRIILIRDGWALAAAIVPGSVAEKISADTDADQISELETLAKDCSLELITEELSFELFNYPHDVIAQHMDHCGEAVEQRIKNGDYREVNDNVFVANDDQPETAIPPSSVFDTTLGPVVFKSNTNIGPFCFFRGPIHIGANCKISEHSSIKDSVAISHNCKFGGEAEGIQVEPWSNKQHHGFLGHSYIGSWINLGAGTCNSDLKNTYGTVNMIYGGRKVSTGMQFVGCVMGDYSRTAINTSIYTGKIIGVGSTVYGMTPHNVPSFVNCAQSLNQTGVLPPEVLASIQLRMFERRNVAQRPCDIQLIHDVFTMTKAERNDSWTNDPIAF